MKIGVETVETTIRMKCIPLFLLDKGPSPSVSSCKAEYITTFEATQALHGMAEIF